jgi:diguanylate cyclase (GGDEF)-like protein/PAS domain S-box-containing protein
VKNTTMRRSSYGFVALLVVLVAVGIYVISNIQAARESLEETAEAGGEEGLTVSEMRTRAGEIGDGTLGYVETDDLGYREEAEEGQTGFQEARARYGELVGEDEGRGGEIDALYEEYAPLSETMMDENDEKEAVQARGSEGYAGIQSILQEIQDDAASQGSNGSTKGEEAASMSVAADGLEEALTSYLREPDQGFLDTASGSTGDFNEALVQYRRLQLSGEERDRANELETLFDETLAESNDVLALDYSVRSNEQEFTDLRAQLEGVLDEEVQAQRSLQDARSQETTQILGRTQALILLAFAAILLALAAIPFFGSGAAARVGEWTGRLARKVGEVVGRVRRGDVGVERRLLPVGIALTALLWVAQSVLQAYVFGGGGLLENLFPSRVEELLSRGLVAAALITFLAYVQFVVNRRRQEERRKQEDRRKRENEARLRLVAVVESSDDAIIGRALDGIITSWNAGAERLYGYTAKEVVGEYGFILVPPERSNELLKVLEKLRRRESIKTYETVHMDKNGRLIDVALTISQIRDSAGNTIGYSTITRDITERKRAEANLRQQKDLYEALLHAQSEVGEGLLILEDERIVYTNEAFSQISGHGSRELMALPSVLDLVVPEERASFGERLRRRLGGRADEDNQETVILHESGRRVTVETGIKTTQENGRPRLIVIIRDITERKKAEEALQESEEKYRMLVETVQEGFGIIDAQEKITYCNAAYAAIFEMVPQELVGKSLLEFVDEEGQREALRRTALSENGTSGSYEITITTRRGKRKHLSASATPVTDADGYFQGAVHAITDITERKRAEERLAYMARYDHLTGLGNRVLFQDRLTEARARAVRTGSAVALMFLDLDRFKAVNDALGHDFGDLLLKDVAGRLRGCVRETDTIARLGGDEFSIILENLFDGRDAGLVAQKILDALSQPFDLDGHEVFVSSSIGIAVSPPSGDDVLVRDADAAMYRAKQLGRNNYQFYTPEMNAQVFERLAPEIRLRTALEREEFVLHYQPQVDLKTGQITGAEVLLRWRHPDLGLVTPTEFMHVLEESGLIVPVGDWLLRTACAQGRAWEDAGLPPLRIAVNLSTRQFNQQELPGKLARVLEETGLDPSRLELELTESLLMDDISVTSAMLDEMKMFAGLRLSIDDFGTGYSSLSYLKRFPLDTLKIDQTFVRDVATDPNDAVIVNSIIGLAHDLRLEVIAEGVENEEQLTYLREHGCDWVQGYYFSEPLPAEDFSELLKKGKPLLSVSVRD